jgi:peptidylprolyl isomerase
MRLSRLTIVSCSVIPLAFLTACGSAGTATTASPLDVIAVSGTDKAPTLTFETKPFTVKETTTKVITAGTGAKTIKANPVIFNYSVFNGNDGKQIDTSFGKGVASIDLSASTILTGLGKGMTGQPIGSRLLVAIPPAEAYGPEGDPPAVGATDTVVFLIDVVSDITPLATATGVAVPPKAGLPTATVDGAKPAQIKVPKTAAPTTLVIQPLIKGAGPVVKADQSIKANYTGVLWKDGTKFDASGDNGGPWSTSIGTGEAFPGWDKGLVGATVGSRVLLVVPPADGFGAKGSPPLIGATDTMVFVIDILAIF